MDEREVCSPLRNSIELVWAEQVFPMVIINTVVQIFGSQENWTGMVFALRLLELC